MKKLFSSLALAAVLVSGVFLAVNTDADDLTWGERHPPIFNNIGEY
ncbi:hypothetical protein [Oceanobacillus alkalisoli]|nr:hypothetical protein [Oceanobacillus alkalisoli]MCF3944933.1 hypothetical protein [Oceanobacillus alkalisoli]MCG5104154.1 hypothetical protein [Oceanobacillus alkalisoli]